MINWTYKSEDFKINENILIPEGDHRVRVSRVTLKNYSSGNDGFEIMLDVSGYGGKLWHRIIIDPSNPQKTNHHLGKFFESFDITNYDLNCYEDWVGKEGAVRVKHEDYYGSVSAKVLFCITRAYQIKLPEWGKASYTRSYEKTAYGGVSSTSTMTNSTVSYSNVSTRNSIPTMPNEFTPSKNDHQNRSFSNIVF